MTPQREQYLAKCSDIEKLLRWKLKKAKQVLLVYKFGLNREPKLYPLTQGQIQYDLKVIREIKISISSYRHELNRLKGWDRGVVPKPVGYKELEWYCKCGEEVSDFDTYCSYCGKRLLWKKVK